MIRPHRPLATVAALGLLATPLLRADVPAPAFVYETDKQLTAIGDFDGHRPIAFLHADRMARRSRGAALDIRGRKPAQDREVGRIRVQSVNSRRGDP